MSKLIGFKRQERALKASRIANANPKTVQLADGSYAGCGETIARCGDVHRVDVMLYGARETSAWASDFRNLDCP